MFLNAVILLSFHSVASVSAAEPIEMQPVRKFLMEDYRQFKSRADLKQQFESTKLSYRVQEVRSTKRSFLLVCLDEGSGGYIVNGFLYEVTDDGLNLVVYVPPRAGAVAMVAEVHSNVIRISAKFPSDRAKLSAILEINLNN